MTNANIIIIEGKLKEEKENESKIAGLTKSGDKYTLSKNGVTVSFASADEMKTIEIYSYEKTLSNLIYKPVERQSDGSCVIYPDENYFLNSEKYLNSIHKMPYLELCKKCSYRTRFKK